MSLGLPLLGRRWFLKLPENSRECFCDHGCADGHTRFRAPRGGPLFGSSFTALLGQKTNTLENSSRTARQAFCCGPTAGSPCEQGVYAGQFHVWLCGGIKRESIEDPRAPAFPSLAPPRFAPLPNEPERARLVPRPARPHKPHRLLQKHPLLPPMHCVAATRATSLTLSPHIPHVGPNYDYPVNTAPPSSHFHTRVVSLLRFCCVVLTMKSRLQNAVRGASQTGLAR